MSGLIPASAVILYRKAPRFEIYLVKRSAKVRFMPGFYAFVGGKVEDTDALIPVQGTHPRFGSEFIVCAAREVFEETGVWLASVPPGPDRETLRAALTAGDIPFASVLQTTGATLHAARFEDAGRWITPPVSPMRFDTAFFAVELPPGEDPRILSEEHESGAWDTPENFHAAWQRYEALFSPPVIYAVRELAQGGPTALVRLREVEDAPQGELLRVEFRAGIWVFPVRTPTLPPATHTNTYLVGHDTLAIIDPASPYEDEQQRLANYCLELRRRGKNFSAIWLTHHHADHTGGVNALREALGIPVLAHPATAAKTGGSVTVDGPIRDGDTFEFSGAPPLRFRAVYTPGHAQDHICFFEENHRSLIAGDMVSSLSTIVIDPPEGNMDAYMAALDRLVALAPTTLFPAHGGPIVDPGKYLNYYIRHRRERESAIARAVAAGCRSLDAIVERVYTDVPPAMHPVAARSVLAHLERLEALGQVRADGDAFVPAPPSQPQ